MFLVLLLLCIFDLHYTHHDSSEHIKHYLRLGSCLLSTQAL